MLQDHSIGRNAASTVAQWIPRIKIQTDGAWWTVEAKVV
jgi:hypothetical protein